MKERYYATFVILLATTMLAAVPTRYYVGRIEVSDSFWIQMPDSLDYVSS